MGGGDVFIMFEKDIAEQYHACHSNLVIFFNDVRSSRHQIHTSLYFMIN